MTTARKKVARCGLTAPHALENVQTWTGREGSLSRLATGVPAQIDENCTGHERQGQGGRVERLDRLFRQCCISFAATLDTRISRSFFRLGRLVVGRPLTTRRLHRSRFRPVVAHEAAAPSRRQSQDDAAGESDELEKEGVHIASLYAGRAKSVCAPRQIPGVGSPGMGGTKILSGEP